jgi:hypothetical protein
MDNFKKIIYGRIGEGDVEGAVDLLLEMLQQQDNSKAYKDALFLKSNLHSAKQQYEIKGVIARQEYELVVNKTLLGLENLLEDAEKGPAPESEKPVRPSIVTSTEKNRTPGKTWIIGLVVVALIVVLALLYIQSRGEGFMRQEDPLSEVVERWESGHYEHLYEDLEFLQQNGPPEAQHLASSRLRWLSSMGEVPVFFIDDFEQNPPNPNWRFDTGVPGPGLHRILPTDEGHLLQLEEHEHASPMVEMPPEGLREIQMRFRMMTEAATSFHINLCMEQPGPFPRTTLGFYQEGPTTKINIWEDGQDEEVQFERKEPLNNDQWYHLKIMLSGKEAQVLLDDRPILQFESRRDHIPLTHFNIESLSGVLEVDNLLIFGHREG